MGIVRGKVIDIDTGKGVPGATVTLASADFLSLGVGAAADSSGNYTINNDKVVQGTNVIATSVGYNQAGYKLLSSNATINIELEKDYQELPGVVVKPKPKLNKVALGIGAAALLLLATKNKAKKKISGIFPGGPIMDSIMPVILIGGMYIVIRYGPDILEKFGLKQSKDEKDTEDAVSDPGSYWDPSFWKKGPTGTFVLQPNEVKDFLTLLKWAFGMFNDDEAAVINAFKTLRTQSQLSYLADQFQQANGKRLADWLYKDSWPNDRLSLSEMAEINTYISKLPKFKP